MDYFLIFSHQSLEEANQGRQLNTIEVQLFKLESDFTAAEIKYSFNNLTFGHLFRQAIIAIVKIINEMALNFTNVQLISKDPGLFTSILPQQFNIRKLSMPYVLTNYVDWKKICREKYGCIGDQVCDIAKSLSLIEVRDEEVIIKMIIKRLREDKWVEDTDTVFFKEHQSRGLRADFSYFRCIGLPFQISKNQIVQKLIEPDRFNIKSYGLSLIFQHGKFSGKAVIKTPAEFTEMILRKDRMYIGKRYVEILQINQEEFESYKFREERQREQTRSRDSIPKQRRRRDNSSSSDSPSYSRSRSNEKVIEIHSLLNEAAIKVRGLPYSLNNWDIEEIFKRFNFVRGSIKLGFVGDRKSGEAVVLFPNREEAERALSLHGFVVQGRYLELRLITKENYDRFR